MFDRTTNVRRLGACGHENEMKGSSPVFHTDIEELMLNWWSYSISWLTLKMHFALKPGYYWPLPSITAACKGQTNLTSADLVPQLGPFAASYRWAIFPAMFKDWSSFTSLKLLMRICLHIFRHQWKNTWAPGASSRCWDSLTLIHTNVQSDECMETCPGHRSSAFRLKNIITEDVPHEI